MNSDDDELYDMLNKYKSDFKKEKELRSKHETEIRELSKEVE
jgi:hypothetical protein